MAVFAPIVAACSSSGDEATSTSTSASASSASSNSTADSTAATDGAGADNTNETENETELRWARANLGFVSAYVLARGNSAAIVDTGVAGSADAIGETLQSIGLTYDDVEHLILTHRHGDHVGSTGQVVERAAGATVYAGQADVDGIEVEGFDAEMIVPLVGGDDVFGFETVPTPGHTPGHIAVIDHSIGLLVAGDAIFTENGGVVEGPERFFDDVPQSRESIRGLAELSVNTLLVGHGDPIEANAGSAIADLAASLPG